MAEAKINRFPKTRITTIDVCEMGKRKHHVSGFFEIDVTESRKKIHDYNRNNTEKISFTSWLISQLAFTLSEHKQVASFLLGKQKQVIFNDINFSVIVEKKFGDTKVPIPLVIEQAQNLSPVEILQKIKDAQNQELKKSDMVLRRKTKFYEKIYYFLPGFFRRKIWSFVLNRPGLAFKKMGNVSFTSLGMFGKIPGWFIPISVHPVCFGVGAVTEKPRVVDKRIEIRQILNLSVLIDHDVVDGAQTARFINHLVKNLESAKGI